MQRFTYSFAWLFNVDSGGAQNTKAHGRESEVLNYCSSFIFSDSQHNIYVIIQSRPDMARSIEYPYRDVERFVLKLPPTLQARYLRLTDLMLEFGSNLGMPHTRPMSNGLFELRVQGQEAIARVFYCTMVGQRIVMLHGFVKKSQKTPSRELAVARNRMAEVKKNEAR